MEVNDVPRITCEELKQLIDKGEKVITVDTRKNNSYNEEHIKGAVNIYYNPAGDPMERELMLSALPPDILLVPYCDCIDDSESALMALELISLRYDADKVKVLSGGYLRWKELGYTTEKSEY